MFEGEVSDIDVVEALRRAFVEGKADFVMIDGHTLRNEFLRKTTAYAEEKGWLDLGELIEGDQWSWYEARLTDEGKAILGLG